MKKIFSVFLAVLLCLGACPSVYAEDLTGLPIHWLPVGGVDSIFSVVSYNEERNTLSFSYWDGSDDYRYCCINLDKMTRSEFDWIRPYAEGRAAVMKYDLSGRQRWGFLDENGELAVPLDYDQVFDFSGGSAVVGSRNSDSMRYGLIGPEGQIIALQKYCDLSEVGENLLEASVNDNDQRWTSGLIDRSGRTVLPTDYYSVYALENGLFAIWEWDGDDWADSRVGLADSSGKIILPPSYGNIRDLSDGVAVAGITEDGAGKYGLIDQSGQILVPMEYDTLSSASGGFYIVGVGPDYETRKYGIMDKTGKITVPPVYDALYTLYEGLAAASLDGKWGYIDPAGNTVIPLEYDYAESFCEGFAVVGNRDANGDCRYGAVDRTGKVIVPLQYDYLECFQDGFAQTTVRAGDDDWRYGVVDRAGRTVIPPEYDLLLRQDSGLIPAMRRDADGRERWGMLDTAGKEALPFIYDETLVAHGEDGGPPTLIFVRQGASLGFIELPGSPLSHKKAENPSSDTEGEAPPPEESAAASQTELPPAPYGTEEPPAIARTLVIILALILTAAAAAVISSAVTVAILRGRQGRANKPQKP